MYKRQVDMSIGDEQSADKWNFKELNELILPIIPLKPLELNDEIRHMKKDELKHALKEKATKFYEAKEAEFPDAEQIREIEMCIRDRRRGRKEKERGNGKAPEGGPGGHRRHGTASERGRRPEWRHRDLTGDLLVGDWLYPGKPQ